MSGDTSVVDKITAVLFEKKACDVRVIDVREKTSLADFFVVCHATSEAHSRTLAAALSKASKESGPPLLATDAAGESEWKVLDYGDVIVHLFLAEARAFYDLEGIWTAKDPVAALEARQDLRQKRSGIDVRSLFSKATGGRKPTPRRT